MKQHLFVVIVSFLLLASCKPKDSSPNEIRYSPTQNGFGVVVQSIGVDSGPGAKLYYKGTNEIPALVWPCIGTHGDPLLYTNDIVFLLADLPDDQGRMGGGALIVSQGVGPAMDITEDILKIAAEQAHVDFKKALKLCRPLSLITTDEKIKVVYVANPFADRSVPDLECQITWQRVFDIMQDVKKTGKTNIVVNTDVPYLQKDYGN